MGTPSSRMPPASIVYRPRSRTRARVAVIGAIAVAMLAFLIGWPPTSNYGITSLFGALAWCDLNLSSGAARHHLPAPDGDGASWGERRGPRTSGHQARCHVNLAPPSESSTASPVSCTPAHAILAMAPDPLDDLSKW